ncbi:MAG TPA: phosphoglycerate kinase [Candidatus Kapabacteria bacterium]|nr:phosphoglycerate kinase [Candidatus Kapabacteria bacterium]
MIKSINDSNFNGKRVLIRVDFNVPIKDGQITDTTRIEAALPTIDKVIDDGGIPILMSHLGRPAGYQKEFSLEPIANYLREYYGYNVIFADDCVGEKVENMVKSAAAGDIVLLENLRFHPEEEKNDIEFAKKLASLADVYINDAFGSIHRAHASIDAVCKFFPERYAGYLLLNELKYLGEALDNPKHPFTAILGGAKISGKIDVIRNLLSKCDTILIGGGMTFTFLKAQGYEVGMSLVETDKIDLAADLIKEAKEKNVQLILPDDIVIANKIAEDANIKSVSIDNIPVDWVGVDIGENTIKAYTDIILNSKAIFWNGPLGIFEIPKFSKGTYAIAEALAKATEMGAITIIGGGDSASAIQKSGFADKVTFISTGGGASLEYLEGKILPGLAALEM